MSTSTTNLRSWFDYLGKKTWEKYPFSITKQLKHGKDWYVYDITNNFIFKRELDVDWFASSPLDTSRTEPENGLGLGYERCRLQIST